MDDDLTSEENINELLRRLNMQIIAPTLLSDAEKTIRALVDRLKAADEVVQAAKNLSISCNHPCALEKGELAYLNDGVIEALAKYNGEGK